MVNTKPQIVPHRNLLKESLQKYNVTVDVDVNTSKPLQVNFPYSPTHIKTRSWTDKKFTTYKESDDTTSLFGEQLFSAGSAKAITITEGEYDAISVFQMLGSKWPCVSVRSSAYAHLDCSNRYDYLNSFELIYICFDNDKAGEDALKKVVRLFHPSKIRVVKLTKFKDANEYLVRGAEEEFKRIWYNAQPYSPEGIISTLNEFSNILTKAENKPSRPYPWPKLNEVLKGYRLGETVLITALEGVGKTEFIRAIEYDNLKNYNEPIGIIHLEEPKERILQGLVGLEYGKPVHIYENSIPVNQQVEILNSLVKRDGRIVISTNFGSEDPRVITDKIRYMVEVVGVKYLFLDHITMIVTGSDDDRERKVLDALSTELATLVKNYDFTLFLISHVNDDGKTRGSRNISKIADVRIDLSRNLTAESDIERNITHLMVTKNRPTARTGPAGSLYFDDKTYKITPAEQIEDFTKVNL